MKTFKFTVEIAKRALPVLVIVAGILGSFPSTLVSNTQIRQEVNITDKYYFSAAGAYATSSEIAAITDNNYSNPAYYFEVDASTTAATNAVITLVNSATGATTTSVTINGTSYARYRSAQFLPSASTTVEYKVVLGAENVGKGIIAARIVVLQNAATLSYTETQIEIGNNENYASHATSTLASPKYWSYNSSKWDGNPTFVAEVTYQALAGIASSTAYNTAGTFTVTLPGGTASTSLQLIGGGGAGGGDVGASRPDGGAGGAGGQFAQSTTTATSFLTHSLTVGAGGTAVSAGNGGAGGDSTWDSTAVVAKGGSGGLKGSGAAVASTTGNTTGCVGQTCRAGGTSGGGSTTLGGAGGGGAGTTGAGGTVTSTGLTGGTGTSLGGGAGGAGVNVASAVGNAGNQAGGGGSGAFTVSNSNVDRAGGGGGIGRATTTSIIASTTIAVQEDNGTFGSWTDKVYMVTTGMIGAGTSTRVRSPAFTPTNGRHYRLAISNGDGRTVIAIYNAKIVIDQSPNTVLDSYSSARNAAFSIGTSAGSGQSFTPSSSLNLKSVNFNVARSNSATGNLVAKIYSLNNAYGGGDDVPTGSALATSDAVALTTLVDGVVNSDLAFTFSGVNQIALTSGTGYFVSVECSGCNNSLSATLGVNSSGTHGGNLANWNGVSWSSAASDAPFTLYGIGSNPSLLEPQYLLSTTKLFSGTGLQGYLTKWDSTEWSTSNTYLHQMDANTSSASAAGIYTSGGVLVTGSTIASPNTSATSSSMTMPANGDLDVKATTNNSDVYANRILVDVLIRPSDVTSATVTAGDTLNTLAWTTPSDINITKVMVLASTSAVTFTPVDSTTYSTSTLSNGTRVACYGLQSSCTDTSLSNGTAYHYKIFTLSSSGYWSTPGVTPTGSPATPNTQSYTEQAYKFSNATSTDGQTWTSRTSAVDNTWLGVTYGNNTFVAVAIDGTANRVMTSSDGTTWTTRSTSGKDSSWHGVAYGDGTFVAVSNGLEGVGSEVMTSPDGITWTLRTASVNKGWNAVAYGNGTFVAVANDGSVMSASSSNPSTWTTRTAASANQWLSVVYGNGLFVAVGSGSGGVMTSPDGITWTSQTALTNNWESVTYGNGTFVAVAADFGTTNTVITSTNGVTWTTRTATSGDWIGVTYGNGTFVAVQDGSPHIMTSVDGITWTTYSALTNSWSRITYGNGLFVSVSSDGSGNRVMTSGTFGPHPGTQLAATSTAATLTSTGQAFRLRLINRVDTANLAANSGKSFKLQYAQKSGTCDAAFSGETYADITDSTPIAYYDNIDYINGTTTTATSTDPIDTGRTVRYEQYRENNNFTNPTAIASGEDGLWDFSLIDNGAPASTGYCIRAVKSTDAQTWTARTAPEASGWGSIAYGNGKYVAIASSGTNRVMTSTDGFTWTAQSAAAANVWSSVTYGNGKFVAVSLGQEGVGTDVMTSPDGVSWTSRTAAENNPWNAVTYGNGLFVAIATSGTHRVMTSPDGLIWTAQTASAASAWFNIAYGSGLFVAVSDGSEGVGSEIMTSPDGINWTSRTASTNDYWSSVAYGNGTFVIGSPSITSNFMYSSDGINWRTSTASTVQEWLGLTYGNGLFVAVGYGTVANRIVTSPDGITWTPRQESATDLWSSVTYGNGQFAAVSSSGTIMTASTSAAVLDTYTVVPEVTTAAVGAATTAVGNATDPFNLTLAPGATATATDAFTLQTTNGTDAVTAAVVSLGTGSAHNGIQYVEITDSAGNFVYGTSTTPSSDTPSITLTGLTANTSLTTYKIRITPLSHALMPAVPGATYSVNASTTAITSTNTKTYADVASTTLTIDNLSPGNVTSAVATAGDAQTSLTWTNPVDTDYATTTVLRSTAAITDTPAEGTRYATSTIIGATTVVCSGNEVACTDTGLVSQGATYYYKIFTTDSNGNWDAGVTPTGSPVSTATSTYTQQAYKFFQATSSYDGASWTSRNTAANNSWKSVTFGTSTFVAVASSGSTNRVMTSPDGVSWTTRTDSEDNTWNSVTYGNGLFVAVASSGTHRVMTSPDGINWTNQTAAEANSWKSVTYGNGFFVAVASDGTHQVMTSVDGVTWTAQTAANVLGWHGVTYGNGRFVAVAPSTAGSAVMTSTDGATWATQSTAGLNGGESVVYGNGKYVAVNDFSNGKPVMYSTDGTTWLNSNNTDNCSWFSVTYGNGKFVATCIDDTPISAMYSFDGINWTIVSTPLQTWFAVTYGNGLFVSVSSDAAGGTLAMTSGALGPHPGDSLAATSTAVTLFATGQQFHLRMLHRVDTVNLPTSAGVGYKLQYAVKSGSCDSSFSGETYADITATTPISWYDNSAFHNRDSIFSTTTDPVDGSRTVKYQTYVEDNNFTNSSSTISSGQDGIWDLSLYDNGAAAGSDYCIREVKSTDAQTWTRRTSPNGSAAIAYGGGMFVTGNTQQTGLSTIMTSSPDGITWTARTLTSTDYIGGIGYGNSTFVAVGLGTHANTSSDGITWNQNSNLPNQTWNDVTYGNGLFVAVAGSGSGNRVATSPEGIVWTSRTSAADNVWIADTYGNGMYVAVACGVSASNSCNSTVGSRVMTSADGINWTLRGSSSDTTIWYDITYGNGLFVAGGSAGALMTSPDGITWTTRTSGLSDNTYVGYGNGLFTAVSNTSIATSPDGVTWTLQTSPAQFSLKGVVYGNGTWVTSNDNMTASTSATTFSSYGGGSNPFTNYRTITVDPTKVSNTDQTDFPVGVIGTYSYLATVGNGGKVQNANGYDVGFYTNSDCSTGKLNWETEKYVASTGEVVYWVKVSTVSHTSDTVFYMCYGNSSITTDQSNKTAVWDSNFVGVYHLPDGTTLSATDSTSNGNNGTNHSATAGTGQIDGAAVGDNSSTYIDLGTNSSLNITNNITVSGWFKFSSYTNGVAKEIVTHGYDGTNTGYDLGFSGGCAGAVDTNRLEFVTFTAASGDCAGAYYGGKTFSSSDIGTWYYAVGSFNGTLWNMYLNGVKNNAGLGTQSTHPQSVSANGAIGAEYETGSFLRNFGGSIDEVRISNTNRSDDWIATEYNNESSPSNFYTVGSESSVVTSAIAEVITYPISNLVTELHYRWRNDDGTEVSATYPVATDTAITSNVFTGDRVRLRFQLSGTGTSNSFTYQLEQASSSCTLWIPVPTAATNGTHWRTDSSQYFLNGAASTNSTGISDPAGQSFVAGVAESGTALTTAISLTQSQFTEIEYTMKSTSSVVPGQTYCFRVTNAGDATKFTYTQTPQISVQANSSRKVNGGTSTEGSGTGPTITGGNEKGGGSGTSGNAGGEGTGTGGSHGGGNEGGGGAGSGDTGYIFSKNFFALFLQLRIPSTVAPFLTVKDNNIYESFR